MKRFAAVVVGLGFGLAAAHAAAQTVYRCANAYSHVPCASGQLVDVSDVVTTAQRSDARDQVLREQRLGETMARERRAEAAALHPALAANVGPRNIRETAPPPAKRKAATRRKPASLSVDGDFIARLPKTKAAAT